jgi:Restriction Endonuclease associating with ARP
LDAEIKRKIEANLFPAAWASIEDWSSFLWHQYRGSIDTWKKHSSQALVIDLFGTLKCAQDSIRNLVLDGFAASIGLPTGGKWSVELEWTDDSQNRLEEDKKTQVDAIARSPKSVILFECKFTEAAGGCSQTKRQRRERGLFGPRQCNGRYEMQINPANGVESRCALSGKEIRYWEVVPKVFKYDLTTDINPCPFRDSWFQLMRNMVLAWQIARDEHLAAAFVVVYADRPDLPFPQWLRSSERRRFMRALSPEAIVCRFVSYQRFIRLAEQAVSASGNSPSLWRELSAWIGRKISTVPPA